MTLTHPFTSPLHTDMTSRYDEVGLYFEINLSWRADPGSPPLALLRVPSGRPPVINLSMYPSILTGGGIGVGRLARQVRGK